MEVTKEAMAIEWLCEEIRKVDADERFHYPCANVVVNAPLALVQLEMEARVGMAQRLLKVLGYTGPETKVRPKRGKK